MRYPQIVHPTCDIRVHKAYRKTALRIAQGSISRTAVAVNQKQHKHLSAICPVQQVRFEALGRPILTASCYCMRGAGKPDAGLRDWLLRHPRSRVEPVAILYRKDRVPTV